MSVPILSLITFLPIIGVILILSIDSKKQELIRITSLLVSIVVFLFPCLYILILMRVHTRCSLSKNCRGFLLLELIIMLE